MSVPTPKPAVVVAEAKPEFYVKDSSRWGNQKVAEFFPGFKHVEMATSGAVIRLRHGGDGPPLLLLHGNPQNHVHWHKVASALAKHYHVVLPDLRGYGDSSLPEPGQDHENYTFRNMALDMVEVMEGLGYKEYFLAGVDRGGRTSFRMCLDYPERIRKVCLMDIIPNYYVWANPTKNWVIKTWHWGFMAQPEPFPERLISAVPAEYFLKSRMTIRGGTGLSFFNDDAMDEYIRCYTLKTITGSCRDYRATATSDHVMDDADKDRTLDMPLMLLWGARGQVPERSKAFVEIWKKTATNIEHSEPIACGHYMAEEVPDIIIDRYTKFFQ